MFFQVWFIPSNFQDFRPTQYNNTYHKHNTAKQKVSCELFLYIRGENEIEIKDFFFFFQLVHTVALVRSFKLFLYKVGVTFTSTPKTTVNSLVMSY